MLLLTIVVVLASAQCMRSCSLRQMRCTRLCVCPKSPHNQPYLVSVACPRMLQFSSFTHVLMLVRAPPAELVEKHQRLMTHHPMLKQIVDTGATADSMRTSDPSFRHTLFGQIRTRIFFLGPAVVLVTTPTPTPTHASAPGSLPPPSFHQRTSTCSNPRPTG